MARARTYWLLILLLLTACTLSGGNENQYSNAEYEKYFTGTEGVIARFVNMPQTLYYYGPEDNAGNEFTFGVEVQNEGASFSRGGVYVSGFDPRLLVFREIPITGANIEACGISLGTIGFGEIGGVFRCGGAEIAASENFQTLQVDSFNNLLAGLTNEKKWLDESRFDFGIQAERSDFGENFVINMADVTTHAEYYQHGRLMIGVFSALNFIKYSGREFLLAGDTYEWPGGEYEYYSYNGRIVNWPPGLDETDQKLLLTSCYLYTTFASPIVCIDPEPYSENRKVCRPVGRSYGSNGAPLSISSITQENTPRKIIFHINVENVGGGTVYDSGDLEKCSPYYPGRVTPEDLNVVYLGDVRIGDIGLNGRGGRGGITCSPEKIRLDPRTGRGSTTCTYPIEFQQIKSAYQAPLTVELWYGYSETEETTVRLKRVI